MVILTIIKAASEGKKRRQTRNFNSFAEAIRYGQISGLYYEVLDTLT